MRDISRETTVAALPAAVATFAVMKGVSPAALFARLGVTAEQLANPDADIPYQVIVEAWRALIEHCPDEPLGLEHASMLHLSMFGALGYAVSRSPNLRHAFGVVARFQRLVDPFLVTRVVELPALWRFEIEHEQVVQELAEPLESITAGALTLMRQAVGEPVTPLEVHFPHPQRHTDAVYQAFFGCPVFFDRARAALVLDAADAVRPLVAADPRLGHYLEEYLATLATPQAPEDDLISAIRASIHHVFDGPDTIQGAVAKRVALSRRTMQRRLRELGTSFTDILEEERRAKALYLIKQDGLPLYEIAFILGYSEPSAFQRAFKRWTGMPAGQFRSTQ